MFENIVSLKATIGEERLGGGKSPAEFAQVLELICLQVSMQSYLTQKTIMMSIYHLR